MGYVKFGNIELAHGLALAPLAGVSDRAMRRVCRRMGAEYTVSEMVSAKALVMEQKNRKMRHSAGSAADRDLWHPVSGTLASILPDEWPMAVQLFGHEPEVMAAAARLLTDGCFAGLPDKVPPAAIDINMGCPVHKIVGNGEGSALMKDPDLAGDIVRAVVEATSLPVTVKLRAGWDAGSVNAPRIARICQDAGASMLCIHGRTRAQGYNPGVDRSVIRAVKEAVSIPVMGNGDLYTAKDALSMMEETGCDGVMIARGAMGNPWLFAEIQAAMEGNTYTPPPPRERFMVALAQVRDMMAEKGDRVALAEAKKHLAWYCRGLDGAAGCRADIMRASTYEEMEAALFALADAQPDTAGRHIP